MDENILQTTLTLQFFCGNDEDGNEIYTTKNFSNIANTATNEQLKNSAQALASLQQFTLNAVTRTNQYDIFN